MFIYFKDYNFHTKGLSYFIRRKMSLTILSQCLYLWITITLKHSKHPDDCFITVPMGREMGLGQTDKIEEIRVHTWTLI